MVTPPASSKPCFLEKVARSTLVLCHAFPQERPTGRSGTASAGSGKSAVAEVPSFSRDSSWRLGRLATAGAAPIWPTAPGFFDHTQQRGARRASAAGPLVENPPRRGPGLPHGLLCSPVGMPTPDVSAPWSRRYTGVRTYSEDPALRCSYER